LPLRPFCRGCIIATRGYDFREGHQAECRSVFLIDFFDRIDSVAARRGVWIRRFGPYGVKVARD
jgi:hypothetical protein